MAGTDVEWAADLSSADLVRPSAVIGGGAILLVVGALALLPNVDQPLVDGYVDRQCHTAMIARNLLRGGSLLYPTIDVGPFPAYYMLEFPLYQALVAVFSHLAGAPVDVAGRVMSATCSLVAALLIWRLVLAEGLGQRIAVLAGVFFLLTPVTLRYGRAVQPDSLMLALLLTGFWSVRRAVMAYRTRDLVSTAVILSLAVLVKGTVAWGAIALVAYSGAIARGRGRAAWGRTLVACAAAIAAALPWYLHAMRHGIGPSGGFWAVHKWLPTDLSAWLELPAELLYRLGWRTLGPGLCLLACLGVPSIRQSPFVRSWCMGSLFFLPVLLRKADHEHYYLIFAPPAAIAAAAAVVRATLLMRQDWGGGLTRRRVPLRAAAAVAVLGIVISAFYVHWKTRVIPGEWRAVQRAARAVREVSRPNELIVGAAPVLFYADRKGFATAHRPEDVRLWLEKWANPPADVDDPVELLEFYSDQGACYAVELYDSVKRVPGGSSYWTKVVRTFDVVRKEQGAFVVVRLGSDRAR